MKFLALRCVSLAPLLLACAASSEAEMLPVVVTNTGGTTGSGGTSSAVGGSASTGGTVAGTGGTASGGAAPTTGGQSSGGSSATGGSSTGGTSSGGSVATGGSMGSGGVTSSDEVALDPVNGWVQRNTNTVAIQGALYTFKDTAGSTISPASFASAGADICVSGKAEQVNISCGEADCYAYHWGAAVGFNLNQEAEMDPLAYNATAQGVIGFAFTLTGTVPAGMRFQIKTAGGDFCTPSGIEPTVGENSYGLSQLKSQCWLPGTGTPNGSSLSALQWMVVASDQADKTFNFCITDIKALK